MELRPGYKQTEIGVLSEDWDVEFIENIAEIKTGSKNTQDKVPNGEYPFFVRSQNVERINSYSFDGEAVLTAGDGVGTGKVFHYIKGKFEVHQRVYQISKFSEKIDGYFFYLYFSTHFYDRIMQMTAKSSVDSVRREMIAEMPIVLPPITEQKAIAAALSDVDALLSSLDALIAKKSDMKKAAMQELLTGKTRLPGFGADKGYVQTEVGIIPADWETKSLGEILVIGHGRDYKELPHGDVPVYGTGGYITSVSSYLHDGETVCIGRKGTIDNPMYFNGKIWTVDTLFFTHSFVECVPKFLFYVFCTINWRSYNEATGVPSLTAKLIESIQIQFPSREEQQAIADVLSDMDAELEALEARYAKVKDMKTGMMQELLTGKTRLVSTGEQHG